MLSDALKDLFRREMADEEADFLWSDEDVYGYIDDAQKMFCRLTDGISDATSSLTRLTIAVNATWLRLNPAILKIRSAYLVSTGAPVEIINQEDMASLGMRFDGRLGPLCRLVTGLEEDKLRCWPVVSLADVVQLSVFRLPLDEINAAGQELEIPEQHHRHLLLWVKHLAYLKQDAETFNRTKAEEFETKFISYCATAKHEQQQKRHKVRVVKYAGI